MDMRILIIAVILTAIEVNGNCPFASIPANVCGVVPKFCVRSRYRSLDGSCNNLKNPQWGTPNSPYARLTRNTYLDGVYKLNDRLLNPRQISLEVFPSVPVEDPIWNLISVHWGQVVAHDMAFTKGVPQTGVDDILCCTDGEPLPPVTANTDPRCAPIAIPSCDPYNAPEGRTCINFYRTSSSKDSNCTVPGKVVEVLSGVTAYIDLSLVYGNSLNDSRPLRLFEYGKLKYVIRKGEPWLPQDSNVTFACNNVVNDQEPCYKAGDIRVNQNPNLALMQNVLMREHNRIAEKLCLFVNPHWNDERCFQEARRILIAKAQHITYNEYLRTILGDYAVKNKIWYPGAKTFINDYDERVNSQPSVEHSTGAFRSLHSQVVGIMKLFSETRHQKGEIRLSDWYNRPAVIEEDDNFCTLSRGLATQRQDIVDRFFDAEVVEFFFRPAGSNFGDDLRAIDIKRSRDHGVGKYIDLLALFNRPRPKCFEDLHLYMKPDYIKLLKRVYKTVDDIELIVAGLLETHVSGTLVGPTFLSILLEQFYRTRVGDRYFYEGGNQDGSFTIDQLNSIRKGTTMARMMCDNIKCIQKMQPDAFLKISDKNPLVSCKSLPEVDLYLWKEKPY